MRTRTLLAGSLAPLLALTVAGCSDKKDEEAEKNKIASCEGKLTPGKAEAALPADLPPGIQGATFFDVQTDGATKRYFAYYAATDVVKTRDTVRDAFTAAGYEIEGSDAEGQAEAEFEWVKGSNAGSVQVIPYCEGYQRLRWRVGPK